MTTRQSPSSPDAPLTVHADPPPVRLDEHGRFRVGQTRVLLDLVVHQYNHGATPEEIVRAYASLSLPEVHAAIAYYLRHRDEITEYLRRGDVQAEELRQKLEREGVSDLDLGRRLRARQAAREAGR